MHSWLYSDRDAASNKYVCDCGYTVDLSSIDIARDRQNDVGSGDEI